VRVRALAPRNVAPNKGVWWYSVCVPRGTSCKKVVVLFIGIVFTLACVLLELVCFDAGRYECVEAMMSDEYECVEAMSVS
jgi:hypothetical protein